MMFSSGFEKVAVSSKTIHKMHESILHNQVLKGTMRASNRKIKQLSRNVNRRENRVLAPLRKLEALENAGASYSKRKPLAKKIVSNIRKMYEPVLPKKKWVPKKSQVSSKTKTSVGKKTSGSKSFSKAFKKNLNKSLIIGAAGVGGAGLIGAYLLNKKTNKMKQENATMAEIAPRPQEQIQYGYTL